MAAEFARIGLMLFLIAGFAWIRFLITEERNRDWSDEKRIREAATGRGGRVDVYPLENGEWEVWSPVGEYLETLSGLEKVFVKYKLYRVRWGNTPADEIANRLNAAFGSRDRLDS